MSANFNEAAYGGIADSYAQKYGIPTEYFRSAIRSASNFDPLYTGKNGDGIAGLSGESSKYINPFSIGESLDVAAQYIKKTYEETKDWDVATQNYATGYDTADAKAKANGETLQSNEEKEADAARGEKAFWQYSADDWKALFAKSAWGLLFGLIGAVLVIASLYVVVVKSGDGSK
jgi:hypothetical protein